MSTSVPVQFMNDISMSVVEDEVNPHILRTRKLEKRSVLNYIIAKYR